MMKTRRNVLIVPGAYHAGILLSVWVAFSGCPAGAQEEHPNRATGTRSETLYSEGQENINLYNGNVTYQVPLGSPVPVGPMLRLGATLTYNSAVDKTWTIEI